MMIAPGQIHVLVIENDPQQVILLRDQLAHEGGESFELECAETVEEGLAAIARGGVHLILLDLGLPDSSGFATFANIANAAPHVPVIILSGDSEEALAVETVHNGAQDYLVKTRYDHHLLIRSMRYALERKGAQVQIEKANANLERRVEERTEELTRMNERLLREVADRVRAEEAVIEGNRQLSEAMDKLRGTQQHIIQRERLHALGRMASGIAHDFNNALAPILGFSELLLLRPETLEDREKVRDYLEMIRAAAQDSAKVVARLREFYRYREEEEVFAPVSVNDLIQQVISMTQPRWKDQSLAHGVNIRMKTQFGNVRTVLGNESELREMLMNIVFNSIDAMLQGGTITFRTSERDDHAIIKVIDTGVGMTEEVRLRCLEPFFSTKEEHGTGLGLGIVYGILRRHEGRIEISSTVGEGTTMTLFLPTYKDQDFSDKPAPSRRVDRSLRILVVEDEPLVREVIGVYLSEDKHEVEMAGNGREGLAKFRAGRFDLVLTDRAMPEMNGDRLAAEINALDPDVPIILLTGFGDLMTDAGERPPGVDLVVGKPFTLGALREGIAKVLAMRTVNC